MIFWINYCCWRVSCFHRNSRHLYWNYFGSITILVMNWLVDSSHHELVGRFFTDDSKYVLSVVISSLLHCKYLRHLLYSDYIFKCKSMRKPCKPLKNLYNEYYSCLIFYVFSVRDAIDHVRRFICKVIWKIVKF